MRLSFNVTLPQNVDTNLVPIVLLHGRMDSKKTWKHLAPKIADKTRRKVICVDARNHGDSPWSDEMNSEVLARDMEEFLTVQNIKRVLLVGHSMGGRTAMILSLQKPEMVEKLVVEDVTTTYDPLAKMVVLQIMQLLKKSLVAIPPDADEKTAKAAVVEFIKSQLPQTFTEAKNSTIFDLDTIPLTKKSNQYTWEANMDLLEKNLTSDEAGPKLTGVYDGPALFLYGTESFFDVLGDENINVLFPKAEKVPIKGGGHLVHQDYPEEYEQLVTQFINNS